MVVSPAKRRAVEALAIDDGIRIHFMPARKFKTAVFCALVRRTLTKEEATQNAVLPGVLMRGCEKYNTFGKMQAAVEDLYGSVYDCMIVKKGEEQILEFYFDGLTVNDAFYNGLSFLKEAMLNPLAPNGAFKEEYFQGAIENQKNEIESRINNKAEYCKQKLFERMCEKERFSVYAGGSLDELGGLTGKSLLAHYWKILRSSQI
ncbi:MAG: hypothetical protein LBC41_17985, partial [Clostridiales bacterium]|nr:hypothetical protein [Clostridiales bacterium]